MILQAELWIQAPRNGDVANILAQFFANKSRTNYSLDNIYILYKYIYTHIYTHTIRAMKIQDATGERLVWTEVRPWTMVDFVHIPG